MNILEPFPGTLVEFETTRGPPPTRGEKTDTTVSFIVPLNRMGWGMKSRIKPLSYLLFSINSKIPWLINLLKTKRNLLYIKD
jgi:hypothetical protein